MFSTPRYVLKAGRFVVENGELRTNWPSDDPHDPTVGRLLHVNPDYDTACEADIRDWFEANYTVQMSNYTIREEELGRHAQIPLKPHAS